MWKDFFIKSDSVIYIFGFIFLFQIWMSWGVPALSDELPHFVQVKEFAIKDNPRILPLITTPTYLHRFVSTGLELSDTINLSKSFLKWRLISTKELFDLFVVRVSLVILIFLTLLYCSAIRSQDSAFNKNIGLLSIIIIPIIFPFVPLIYTDVLAVSLILLGFTSALYGKTYTSAASILIATIVRQPSITWIIPLMALVYTKEKDLKKILPHLLVLISFGAFTLLNKGIAVGDRTSHEIGLHLQNMWFFGFVFFITTIGYFYSSITEGIKKYVRENKSIVTHVLALCAIFAIFIIYTHTYEITHKYNESRYGWFLRNRLLVYTTTVTWAKIVFGLISMSGLYMFIKTAYTQKYRYSEYLFKAIALLSISAMPLVEQRYYIPIFVLTAFYISTSDQEFKVGRAATIQTIFNIVLGLYFFISIMHMQFFL